MQLDGLRRFQLDAECIRLNEVAYGLNKVHTLPNSILWTDLPCRVLLSLECCESLEASAAALGVFYLACATFQGGAVLYATKDILFGKQGFVFTSNRLLRIFFLSLPVLP